MRLLAIDCGGGGGGVDEKCCNGPNERTINHEDKLSVFFFTFLQKQLNTIANSEQERERERDAMTMMVIKPQKGVI